MNVPFIIGWLACGWLAARIGARIWRADFGDLDGCPVVFLLATGPFGLFAALVMWSATRESTGRHWPSWLVGKDRKA